MKMKRCPICGHLYNYDPITEGQESYCGSGEIEKMTSHDPPHRIKVSCPADKQLEVIEVTEENKKLLDKLQSQYPCSHFRIGKDGKVEVCVADEARYRNTNTACWVEWDNQLAT